MTQIYSSPDLTTVPAGTPGFDPFRRMRERSELERQLRALTYGDCGAMFAAGLARQGIACGVKLTDEQQSLVDRLRELGDASPFRAFADAAKGGPRHGDQ